MEDQTTPSAVPILLAGNGGWRAGVIPIVFSSTAGEGHDQLLDGRASEFRVSL